MKEIGTQAQQLDQRTGKQPRAGREELRMHQEMIFASGVSRGKKTSSFPAGIIINHENFRELILSWL